MVRSALFFVLCSWLTACTHQIAFTDLHYPIQETRRQEHVVAVIDGETLALVVPVNSFLAGSAHTWNALAGQMLRQVAEVELSQLFAHYAVTTTTPEARADSFVIALRLLHYRFAGFHAELDVAASVSRGGVPLFDRNYHGEGPNQSGKVFWGGAFAMKSAMRQSSLFAFREVFRQLRQDLRRPPDPRPVPAVPAPSAPRAVSAPAPAAPSAPATSGGEAPLAPPQPASEAIYPAPAPATP